MAPTDLISVALATVSDRQLGRALVVLTRAAAETDRQKLADAVRSALDDHLPELVQRAADAGPDDDLREALHEAVVLLRPETGAIAAAADLPEITTALSDLVTQVLLTAALALEAAAANDEDEVLAELAQVHASLSSVFSKQGRRNPAVAACQRAVQIRRRLVERHLEGQVAGLATALNSLSVNLDDLGRRDDSLQASEEAASLFRRLVETEGPSYLPSLANALGNMAVGLAAAGRDADALAATEEAVAGLRGLVEAGADEQRLGLAWALHNLSVRLAAQGRDTDALKASEEAVSIRRELAEPGPDRSRDDLASSLTNYSARLSAVGRHADALAATKEAVRIRRQLAETNPGQYLPGLATSLSNMSVDLGEMGLPAADALAAAAEAVQIRRDLARMRPEVFRPGLATSLHNMSVDLAATGEASRALEAIEESVAIRRSLAANKPDLYASDLAGSLRNLSVRLAAAGRPAAALEAAEESVGSLRSLAERQPDAYSPGLATSLNNLSVRLSAVKRYPEALAAIEEAVQLRRALAAGAPDAYLPALAISLNNLSVGLSRVGQAEQAQVAAEEAVRIRRAFVAARPGRHIPGLATALNNLAVDLGDAGRNPEAVSMLEEVVQIRRRLATSQTRSVLPDLVMSLNNLSEQLDKLGRRTEAGQLFAELLAGYQGDTWATGVILLGRGAWHSEGGNVTAAISDAYDAAELLRTDPPRQAQAQRLLRNLRRADPVRFDQAWDGGRDAQPVWLRHLELDQTVADQIDRWLACQTFEEEQAFLAANTGLVSEEAEAVLERLIEDNPGHQGLRAHRDIIRAARIGSIEDAYTQYSETLWQGWAAEALATWVSAAEEELQGVLAEDTVLLLSQEAADQADNMLATSPRTPGLLWRVGLLALCRSDGAESAFQILGQLDTTLRWSPGELTLTASEPRDLALARIRAGRHPDDPEASFVHAVFSLAAGHASEADEAIARCAESSTSWDRRARAAHLTEIAAIRPDLADGLARLRSIMATAGIARH